jgi:hypothetical protein
MHARRLSAIALLLLASAGCGWQPPLRPQQVISGDAYQAAPHTMQRIEDDFTPLAVAPQAHQRGMPLRFRQAWLLLDQSAAMQTPAAGYAGTRAQLANTLATRLAATITPAAAHITLELIPTATLAAGSSLAAALAALSPRLPEQDSAALMIFSRAERIDAASMAAAARLQQQRPQLCLHLISIGDAGACFKLRRFGRCGSAVRGEDIADAGAMAAYALKVFYGEAADSDGDGIEDYKDHCPATAAGERINWDGCPFDEAALRNLLHDGSLDTGAAP